MIADVIVDNDDDGSTAILEKFIKTQRKGKTHLRTNDIYLDLKPMARSGKCRGTEKMRKYHRSMKRAAEYDNSPAAYNTMHSLIWYHVADYISPEYVQTFALICRQTADIVNTRRFWNRIYKNYCMKSLSTFGWVMSLPHHLSLHSLRDCDKATLRTRVIESLFLTYEPLSERNKNHEYVLDRLLGYIYVASWYEQDDCIWRMCYKFRQKNTSESKRLKDLNEVLSNETDTDDWETLVGKFSSSKNHYPAPQQHINHDVCLLVISCERFLPFPNQLLYESGSARISLLATRQMLATDMRSLNLELDFRDLSSKVITTVKYSRIVSCKAYNWWHPDFRKYLK
ncbi:transmembrane protein 183 isoform X2 [Eurosta solidaginis]|uniref:transmembrane protein 183 isoform X2 n=1 Tax=Eurosta solidaginis TaxID=178769 RepID=UPI0035308115